MKTNTLALRAAVFLAFVMAQTTCFAQEPASVHTLNEPLDVSPDFSDFGNTYYLARKLADFDPKTGAGHILWRRSRWGTEFSFNQMRPRMEPGGPSVFPNIEYDTDPTLPFSIEFTSPRTIRIRMATASNMRPQRDSLMLVKQPAPDNSWQSKTTKDGYEFTSDFGSVTIHTEPWLMEIRDKDGKLLTSTRPQVQCQPFNFVRRSIDFSRSIEAVFSLSPEEKLFGCGESFTGFNKRGQKLVLWPSDPYNVEKSLMYKPVPFFMSSRGYGMFVHSSSPMTFDMGQTFASNNILMIGDDELDLFIFLGTPKEILNEYTNLTGKAPMPPLWSFGLWMSRITYSSEKQVREVAAKLRQNKIPCDVIHLDTGWFQTDWRCDYEFAKDRFPDPAKMISDLKSEGFHISLWQIPYFVPKNRLFPEIVQKGLAVKDAKGNLPTEDAILDFSNPDTVKWYQDHLAPLLKMGVGAIKVDFGEAAPRNGIYASGTTGFYEHNLYPLRYQKAVAEITKQTTGDNIIWARAGWAGSQRYPIHWGGDCDTTDGAMAGELRAGLSLGLCGFSFWSHDIGGFDHVPPVDLYRRWLAFGMLSSHSRCHGQPPREPWEFGEEFMNDFRAADDVKYRLMPYVYAQAKDCTEHGLPMLRALFVEFPDDPGAWLVDDEYFFGSSILVAPLLETGATSRDVYLPPGKWIDYQSQKVYAGGWQHIDAGEVRAVILVRDGTIIPQIALAQSTADMDWSKIELAVFATDQKAAKGDICLPADQKLREISATFHDGKYQVDGDPLEQKASMTITQYPQK